MIQLFPAVASTSAALNAERTRLDIIAQNIANANTTRGLDGKPYQRQQVAFATLFNQAQAGGNAGSASLEGPQISQILKDPSPGRQVYLPGHPHADAQGIVTMPNVNLFEEMADMVVASRTFEANLAVMKNSRSLATQALSIGKR